MSRSKYYTADEEKDYRKVEIDFPFCYKDFAEKNFFRYLNDGRFELIAIVDGGASLHFGNYYEGERTMNISLKPHSWLEQTEVYTKENAGRKNGWTDYEFNWLRMLALRNTVISNEEFEEKFDELITEGYACFLDPLLTKKDRSKKAPAPESKKEVTIIKPTQGSLPF